MLRNARRLAVVLVSLVSCANNDAQFDVEYAHGFQPRPAAISVFGVFEEGKMSPESWELLAPKLASILGDASCPAVIDAALVKRDAALYAAVDDYARDNGVTEDLLAEFADASTGDVIMTITVAGKYPEPATSARTPAGTTPPPPGPPPGRRGGRGRRRASAPPAEHASIERSALEMSATLFSVSQKRSIASVEMKYTGTNTEEAMNQFVAKLRETIPGSRCVAWKNDVRLDGDRIRGMAERQ
jgi:hypothetical protein